MTSDQWVLNTIQHGYRLEFTSSPPVTRSIRQTKIPADPQKSHVFTTGDSTAPQQASYSTGGPDRRGLHLNVLSHHQEERLVAPNSQFSPTQQVHPSEAVPHGNSRGRHTRITQGLVGGIFRFKRRLPPRSHSQFRQEMARFLPENQVYRFNSPSLVCQLLPERLLESSRRQRSTYA